MSRVGSPGLHDGLLDTAGSGAGVHASDRKGKQKARENTEYRQSPLILNGYLRFAPVHRKTHRRLQRQSGRNGKYPSASR